MGSQQLLLIALGVIIVGIAIALANDAFSNQAEERTKEYIILECTNLAADALKYYRTSSAMGGGGHSFAHWNISPKLETTVNGIYGKVLEDQDLLIYGKPLNQRGYNWYVVLRMDGNGIDSTYVHY